MKKAFKYQTEALHSTKYKETSNPLLEGDAQCGKSEKNGRKLKKN